MSGEARIARVGKTFLDYRPGEALSTYVSYFVYGDDSAVKSTNYVEKLATSRCKIASGERLWCGACHDPHRVPAARERVAWYRSKCLSCHAPDPCERGVDCAGCHMPKSPVQDVAHGMLTDHGISKRPSGLSRPAGNGWRLRGFSALDSGNRELGLAYAEVFLRTGDRRQEEEAFRLLMNVPKDKEVELRLAGLFQRRGNDVNAFELYKSVLRRDPGSIVALVNIGAYYGSKGALRDAIALWREALVRNPCQTEAAANLKKALKAIGDLEGVDQIRKSQVSCVAGGE
jgi:tetratricopeptide (TPR) repeat protein